MTGKWQSTVVPPRSGRAWRLAAGQRVRITGLEGSQSGDLFAVAADDVGDGQSNGRTFGMGGMIRLPAGSVLYSRRSRPLLRIAEDEAGVHGMLYAPCSQEMFELRYGVTGRTRTALTTWPARWLSSGCPGRRSPSRSASS